MSIRCPRILPPGQVRTSSCFIFRGPIRSGDQPPVQHIVQIVSIQRESRVICSLLPTIHFVMLLLCDVLGFPRRRVPLTFPCITHFTGSHPPSLIAWPKKESLRRATNPRSCLVVLSSDRILWSVRCSVQLTRNIQQ